MKKIYILLIIVLLAVAVAAFYFLWPGKENPENKICENLCGDSICQEVVCQGTGCPCAETKESCSKDCAIISFEECVAAGNPVIESYPRMCQTEDGMLFVEDIGNELDKTDLITIENPRPNQEIESPLIIKGQARGTWFFEASFPIKLYDGNDNLIASGIAQAKSDWMTEDFVPFQAELVFSPASTEKGLLVLEKDNPSGLPENDDELRVPVYFSKAKQTVNLFYYNPQNDRTEDGNTMCSRQGLVFVQREVYSKDLIKNAINELLKGNLTSQERSQGITTEYPLSGFSLLSYNLKNGILTLTFEDLENRAVGGSCRVGILWFQIETTAKQFPGVNSVRFLPEEIFQP